MAIQIKDEDIQKFLHKQREMQQVIKKVNEHGLDERSYFEYYDIMEQVYKLTNKIVFNSQFKYETQQPKTSQIYDHLTIMNMFSNWVDVLAIGFQNYALRDGMTFMNTWHVFKKDYDQFIDELTNMPTCDDYAK